MNEKVLSVVLLLLVICFIIVNTILLKVQINEIVSAVDRLDLNSEKVIEDAEGIYNDFIKKQRYMSITVSHNDMTSIEDCFVEMIGYLAIDDRKNAEVVKYRLKNSLEHLRRLSGCNIDAII